MNSKKTGPRVQGAAVLAIPQVKAAAKVVRLAGSTKGKQPGSIFKRKAFDLYCVIRDELRSSGYLGSVQKQI